MPAAFRAAGFILCSVNVFAAGPPEYVTYRVMTWNVGSAAHIPIQDRQIEQIADTIVDNAIDVAGFCEVSLGNAWRGGRDHVAEISVALADRGYAMHSYKYPVNPALGGWQVNAILSRRPISHTAFHTFTPPGKVPWHVGEIRVPVSTGTTVRAFMTHIWPPSLDAGTVEKAAAMPLETPGPVTIMGDFNLGTNSTIYPLITKQGWRNSCEAACGEPCPSVGFGAFVAGPLPRTGQIDYVFGNDDIEFIDSYIPYYSMSDHWPVVAVCRVKIEGKLIDGPTRFIGVKPTTAMLLRRRAAELYRYKAYARAAEAWLAYEGACDDAEDAGFAAYSAACMTMLAGQDNAALDAFAGVAESYAGSEWAARSHQRRAFLFKGAGNFEMAEKELLAFLDGYYDAIDPAPRSPAVIRAAEEIVRIRAEADRKSTTHDVLNELLEREPDNMVARSIHYNLGMNAFRANKRNVAREQLLKARPIPENHYRSEARMLADMHLDAGDKETATRFFLQYVGSDANQVFYRAEVARWNLRLGGYRPTLVVTSRSTGLELSGASSVTTDPLVVSHLAQPQPSAVNDEHSATVALSLSPEALVIQVRVHDRTHYAPFTGKDIWRGDCVQIALDPENDSGRVYDDDDFEVGAALTDDGPQAHIWGDQRQRDAAAIKVTGEHKNNEGMTAYIIFVPRSLLETGGTLPEEIGFNIMVADNDGGGRVQWVDWTPGIGGQKAPDVFGKLIFLP